ncbi:flavin monoamine oxidase family protein [Ignatzschineria sp. LJL83]
MDNNNQLTRRTVLKMIGATAGSVALYNSMMSIGLAQESDFTGIPSLKVAPKGATVLILGAGLAGLVAAYELQKVGYNVKIIEYNDRIGGRAWTLRGGDRYTELGGDTQECTYAKGQYFNPGPWRVPYHHQGYMYYAREFDVKMQPFQQFNQNAYLHNSQAFEGKPQRFRDILADYKGHTNELLAKAVYQDKLDEPITQENKEMLLESLKSWGALDKNYRYTPMSAARDRGWKEDPNALHGGIPVDKTITLDNLLQSGLWSHLSGIFQYSYAPSIFQPVGGMDQLPKAMGKAIGDIVTYQAKVTKILQDDEKVTVTYEDQSNNGALKEVSGDWCVCTIPFSILAQIENNLSNKVKEGISSVHYATSYKSGIEFNRRFWEEDDQIYGGISLTNLPIELISYPSNDYLSKGKGVVLASYLFGPNSFKFSSLSPKDRLEKTLDSFVKIHPQGREEFSSAMSVAWHRVPFTLGCYGLWTTETREKHFKNVSTMDNRTVLAGEHISYIPAWQEGAILSALDAIRQLNEHASQRL